jgi:hypothetical protein
MLLLAAPFALAHGCASPSAPVPPPAGGQVPNLDYAAFVSTVEPALERRGCDAGGDCHGGGIRGTLALSPAGAKDPAFDFEQVSRQVSVLAPDSSAILTRPLALDAGGTPHPYKPFASTSDSDYVSIRTWVRAGVEQ